MIKPLTFFECCCRYCGKEWTTKTAAIPAVCSRCHRKGWNDDYVEPVPAPKISLTDRVKRLNTSDRLSLFEHFELCCGMDRGQCTCPDETIEAPKTVAKSDDALAAFIAKAQAAKGITQSIAVEAEPVDEWIGWTPEAQTYDDQTGEMRTYRKHIKTGKVRWIDSEVYY